MRSRDRHDRVREPGAPAGPDEDIQLYICERGARLPSPERPRTWLRSTADLIARGAETGQDTADGRSRGGRPGPRGGRPARTPKTPRVVESGEWVGAQNRLLCEHYKEQPAAGAVRGFPTRLEARWVRPREKHACCEPRWCDPWPCKAHARVCGVMHCSDIGAGSLRLLSALSRHLVNEEKHENHKHGKVDHVPAVLGVGQSGQPLHGAAEHAA